MNEHDFFRGIATQDHELASIRNAWQQTDPDMQHQFLSWLEDDDVNHIKEVFCRYPEQWIAWVQQCATCGLRQAVLDAAIEVPGKEGESDD